MNTRALVSSSHPLRVAIAGQGRSGYKIHADWLRQDPDRFRIVAVADQLLERRRDAAREFQARVYADYRPMLAAGGFDLFVNALPTLLHPPAAIEALRRGYHVVCEKPMAPSVAWFDRMVAAAERSGCLLAPFQNNRLQPFFLKMMEVVRSGVLGELLHVRSVWGGFSRRWDWQTLQRHGGGVLFNTGPHALDQAVMLLGEDQRPEVLCRMAGKNRLGGDAEDFCALTLHGPGLPLIEILLTHYQAYPPEDLYHLSGTLGGLSGSATALKWKYYDPRKAPKQKMWPRWSLNRAYPWEALPWAEKSWTLDAEQRKKAVGYTLQSFQSGVALFYANVYDVLLHGAAPLITLPQVRRQIEITAECRRQNRTLLASLRR